MSNITRRSFLAASTLAAASLQAGATPTPKPRRQVGKAGKNTLRVALLQMHAEGADQSANLEKADAYCRQAARMEADIALLPEMFNIGYSRFQGTAPETVTQWQAQAVAEDSPWVQHFRALAQELHMAIATCYLQTWPDAPRNVLTLFDRHGQSLFTYGKIHTCDFGAMETATTPGDGFHVRTLDTAKGPVEVGAMICYDREFPESARILMVKGAEIILTPNACKLDELRLRQFQTRAWENSLAVFMTNYAAPQHNGHSVAYDANGDELALADEAEDIVIADLDLAAMRKYRETSIFGNAFRRPHRYGTLLESKTEEPWHRKNGFDQPFERESR